MKIEGYRGPEDGSPLEFRVENCPPGIEGLIINGSMVHDGSGYFLNFETPRLRYLSSLCQWLESQRPGLVVSRLINGHLTKEDSSLQRGKWQIGEVLTEKEWVIRVKGNGELTFLMAAQFEWRVDWS